jgi:hypothetical protein
MQKRPLTKFTALRDKNLKETRNRKNLPQHNKGRKQPLQYSQHCMKHGKMESMSQK